MSFTTIHIPMTSPKNSEWDRYPAGLSTSRQEAITWASGKTSTVVKVFRVRKVELQIEVRKLGKRFLWRVSRRPK